MEKRGTLFVLSGPSGVGKGSVCKGLDFKDLNMEISVSMTTRKPRPGEIPGVSYHYVTWDEFQKTIDEDGFMEHAVFNTCAYGTPEAPVEKWLSEGKNVLLEIETNGARQVMERHPEAVTIFLLPPSHEELEARIRGRGTEKEEDIQKRLAKSFEEISLKDLYKYNVVNNDLDETIEKVSSIIKNEGNCA